MTPERRRLARQAVQVYTGDGRWLSGGRATLFVLEQVGWHPRLARWLARPPFIWAVELGYRLVAWQRGRLARWRRSSPEP